MCKRIFKEQTQTEGDIPFYKIGTFGKAIIVSSNNRMSGEGKF
jgi:type I restriction enzyme S subunit